MTEADAAGTGSAKITPRFDAAAGIGYGLTMNNIHGNPIPDYVYIPVMPPAPEPPTPFPGLCVMIDAYAVFAFLYVCGLINALPRTGAHDAFLAAAFGLTCAAWACWGLVRKIPYIGTFLYVLPALALIASLFGLDFYLMFGR
jgi:hypothetical protein